MVEFSFWYITIGFIGLCLTMDLMVIALFIFRLWCQPLYHKKSRYHLSIFIKYLSIICFVACTGNIGCDLIHNIWGYILRDDISYALYTQHYHFLIGTADIFYYTATLSLYSIIIYRLYTSFSGSRYALSTCTISFIMILMILSCLEAVTYITSELIWKSEHIEYEIIGSLSIVYIVIDVTLNLTVFILFISKLRSSTVSIDNNDDRQLIDDNYFTINDQDQDENKKKSISLNTISLNQNQKLFLDLMTRYTLLSCCAIIFNQFFNGLAIWNTFYYDDTPDIMVEIAYMFRSLENVINVIVIYLNFGFNLDHYYKICSCSHQFCYKMVTINTKKTIKRQILARGNSSVRGISVTTTDYSTYVSSNA